jgi:hypothetical protein
VRIPAKRSSPLFWSSKLLPEKRKQQGQEDTDEDGGNNGKVESEVLFFDDNIPGKSPDPRNLLPDQQKDPDQNNKNTH